uniref:Uncharacterized protein n=1 Tax=Romanomermis culicivorax TaxID=13658 RepID=A0A915JCQ3_ROMCU
ISRISEITSLSLQPFICCQKHFQKATAQIEQIGLKEKCVFHTKNLYCARGGLHEENNRKAANQNGTVL